MAARAEQAPKSLVVRLMFCGASYPFPNNGQEQMLKEIMKAAVMNITSSDLSPFLMGKGSWTF